MRVPYEPENPEILVGDPNAPITPDTTDWTSVPPELYTLDRDTLEQDKEVERDGGVESQDDDNDDWDSLDTLFGEE
jgi:hypothetical protein